MTGSPLKSKPDELPSVQAQNKPPDRDNRHDAKIASDVLRVLGRPGNMERVQVRHLWDRNFRVNIFVGTNAASVTVAHSYFLMIDDEGNIVFSNPAITKHY